jgi:hypothetical protein
MEDLFFWTHTFHWEENHYHQCMVLPSVDSSENLKNHINHTFKMWQLLNFWKSSLTKVLEAQSDLTAQLLQNVVSCKLNTFTGIHSVA